MQNVQGVVWNGNVVNPLYYADDLASFSPTASWVNQLFRECEQFSEEFGLDFNEQKSVLSYFQLESWKNEKERAFL